MYCESDEEDIVNVEIPNFKQFIKKFNYCLLRALKPSSKKSGPIRSGCFSISANQYQTLLGMGLSHRFKKHQFLLLDLKLKTSRFFSLKNRVIVQAESFEARLIRPQKLKYFHSDMKSREIQGSEYFLKFKFKKQEQVI